MRSYIDRLYSSRVLPLALLGTVCLSGCEQESSTEPFLYEGQITEISTIRQTNSYPGYKGLPVPQSTSNKVVITIELCDEPILPEQCQEVASFTAPSHIAAGADKGDTVRISGLSIQDSMGRDIYVTSVEELKPVG